MTSEESIIKLPKKDAAHAMVSTNGGNIVKLLKEDMTHIELGESRIKFPIMETKPRSGHVPDTLRAH